MECKSAQLTRFLGDSGENAWLSRDLLDLAIGDLKRRLHAKVETANRLLVGDLLLMQEIRRAARGRGLSKRVYKVGMQVSAGEITHIYQHTLVDKHWVAIHTDIARGLIEYGEFPKVIHIP